jgi:hypothetical protein
VKELSSIFVGEVLYFEGNPLYFEGVPWFFEGEALYRAGADLFYSNQIYFRFFARKAASLTSQFN